MSISIMAIMSYEERGQFACKVCQNRPDEEGILHHGRGCYVISSDGGGEEFFNVEIPVNTADMTCDEYKQHCADLATRKKKVLHTPSDGKIEFTQMDRPIQETEPTLHVPGGFTGDGFCITPDGVLIVYWQAGNGLSELRAQELADKYNEYSPVKRPVILLPR